MTTLQEAARDALEALERIGKDFVCRSAHHAKKDQHSAFAECPVVVRHTDAIESLKAALAQQGDQQPVAWYEYNQDLDAWFLAYGHNPKAKTRPLVFGDTAAPAPQAQERSTCNHCDGTGRVVRDPDIGTDQECFVCDGSGYVKEEPAPQAQPDWLLKTTQDLANSIRRRCYPEVPQFEVLDDLAGVISQIDNMTTGMERKAAPPPAQGEPTGCACRWDADDNRVATCVRHLGWLGVVHAWEEQAKAAEVAMRSAQPVAQYDKTEMNAFVQDLYDKKMQEGKHGHYETMFHVVHKAIARVGIREVK